MAGVIQSSCLRHHRSTEDRTPMPALVSDDKMLEINRIRPYLYLSGCSELTPARMAPLGITAVINCIRGIQQNFPEHIQYHYLPLEDDESQDLTPYFRTVFAIVDSVRKDKQQQTVAGGQGGGRVLIYCGMGISRSAAFSMAYLMESERIPLIEAYRAVQTRRPCVCPNVGFFRQLIDLERRLTNGGPPTVKIIEPTPGVLVPDVVWDELYQEVMQKLADSNNTPHDHQLSSRHLRPTAPGGVSVLRTSQQHQHPSTHQRSSSQRQRLIAMSPSTPPNSVAH